MILIKRIWAKIFTDLAQIDLRSLAAFRFALGSVVLLDLLNKSRDLTAFYTDSGIFPRDLALKYLGWWSFSFHMASGALWFQSLLMVAGCTLAIMLAVGYQTRLAAIGTWLFVISLQGRNYLILHSGDTLIREMLFWAMFLPLGTRWSLDALFKNEKPRTTSIANLASFAILLQLLSMYVFTALIKDHPEWNRNFLAIYYAMQLEQFTTPLGHWLGQQLTLTKILTGTTFYLELCGPILLLTPFIAPLARWIVPLLFIGLHISIAATMNLGMFPWICVAAWFLFIPKGAWDLLRIPKPQSLERLARQLISHLAPPLTFPTALWRTTLKNALVALGLVAMCVWNVYTLPKYDKPIPEWIRTYALPIRLDQYWGMFAPYPMRADGWFVVDGKLRDGKSFDPWNGKYPVDWNKPNDFMTYFRSTAWRKYLFNTWIDDPDKELQLAFGKYICREWNDLGTAPQQDQELTEYKYYYLKENTPPPGGEPIIDQTFLWQHECFAQDVPPSQTPPAVRD